MTFAVPDESDTGSAGEQPARYNLVLEVNGHFIWKWSFTL